jgi:hypothetical protein
MEFFITQKKIRNKNTSNVLVSSFSKHNAARKPLILTDSNTI